MYQIFAVIIVAAYFIGSIPFGLLLARAHGIDLRKIGSGNIGATNVARALGRKWAYLCFVLDVLKGLIPMLIVIPLAKSIPSDTQTDKTIFLILWLTTGCVAILGHIFPIFAKFKGGKGVATSLGVALGLWPYFTICALPAVILWVVFALIWRYVSLASIVASVSFPAALIAMIASKADWEFTTLWPVVVASIAIPLMVVIRHRENIKRLLAGTEYKILQKKAI